MHAIPDHGESRVNDVLPAPADGDRAVVVSHWPVPLDLAAVLVLKEISHLPVVVIFLRVEIMRVVYSE